MSVAVAATVAAARNPDPIYLHYPHTHLFSSVVQPVVSTEATARFLLNLIEIILGKRQQFRQPLLPAISG